MGLFFHNFSWVIYAVVPVLFIIFLLVLSTKTRRKEN